MGKLTPGSPEEAFLNAIEAIAAKDFSGVADGSALLPEDEYETLIQTSEPEAVQSDSVGFFVAGNEIAETENNVTVDVSSQELPSETEIDWFHDAINVRDAWEDYRGDGIIVSVVDNGWVNYNHPDLDDNIRFDLADPAGENGQQHGQATIGLIGAEANGTKVVGVAYNSDIVPELWTTQGIIDATGYADVINNSWSFTDNYNIFGVSTVHDAVVNGRGGLGAIVVFSAGNDRADGMSANMRGNQNSPDTITVAAMDTDESVANFSNPGSSLLVTAPGTGLSTTWNHVGVVDNFSGTSGSAPIVSGVAALILQANDQLGYRDVQQIMAYSATFNDSGDPGWQYNGAENWNGGGLHFSHDHGFGLINARDAVRLAETWQEQSTAANMTSVTESHTTSQAIPDNGSLLTTIDVGGGSDILIETIQVNLDIDGHGEVGELIVTITSPSGTEATLMNSDANGLTGEASLDYTFTANTFRGETSDGTWTLTVEDTASGNAGTLTDWSITFNGRATSADDTYVFSDDYGALFSASPERKLINDSGGIDTINASMVTSDMIIDLNDGATSTIAGNNLKIDNQTIIENVYAGDGDDVITGNEFDNLIWGGRGDDTLDGGQGTDTAAYLHAFADYSFALVSNTLEVTHNTDNFVDTLVNFENFIFDGASYTKNELYDQAGLVNNPPTVTASDTTVNAGQSIKATDVISASDPDMDVLTYTVWDTGTVAGSGFFELDGQELASGSAHVLTEAQFFNLDIVGGDNAGTEKLWVRVSDGENTSTWTSLDLTTFGSQPNTTPTVSANDHVFSTGDSVLASALISGSDADGDPITFTVWDDTTSGSSAYFEYNGQELGALINHTFSADDFANLSIIAGDTDIVDGLRVRVSDGENLSGWADFQVTTIGPDGSAPEVTAGDLTLNAGTSRLASDVINAVDPDGDPLAYFIWDTGTASGSGYYELNGMELAAGTQHTLTEAEFSDLRIVGGDNAGTEKLWVKVSDGQETTSWNHLDLTTTGSLVNTAPTVSAGDVTLQAGQSVAASTAISASDANGDELTYFVQDNTAGSHTGYFSLNGQKFSAGTSISLTEDQFANLNIVAGIDSGTDDLQVRVYDGEDFSAWDNFDLTTTAPGGAAPTLVVDDISLDLDQSVAAASAIHANDPDGDPITYTVWDTNTKTGTSHFEFGGQPLAAGTAHTFNEVDFASLRIIGGDTDGFLDKFWVRISAGGDQSGWELMNVTTAEVMSLSADADGIAIEDVLDMDDDALGQMLEDISGDDGSSSGGDDSVSGGSTDTASMSDPLGSNTTDPMPDYTPDSDII